ncbi:PREDICTED: mitochondrial outer membrane protein porin 2 isoform X1 [Brassica oleracea var. oleracea]|uniref:Mitochondrial outer membrane protein porin 2 n=1 Tax=Brassica oleracea var. oleracea TaxID=109376 RepID=A0A0D3DDR2_BRAOL|nr:PREDICTED: mitochondrial outer membrane protein porin 2 isoform X1 [Brassica oleracea var. oleracea]
MSKGPGLLADIGKKARDLLTRDCNTDHKFSISTNTLSGFALTSTVLRKGVVHAADVSAQYKYRNALFDVKIDTDSNVMTTITITEILPSTKAIASFKVPDYNSSKLEVQYFHDHATVTATAALKQNPLVDLTATLGSPTISFGAEAGYDTTSRSFTKYNFGISVTKPDKCASVILGDKADSIKASYLQHLDESKRSAAVGEVYRKFSTNENVITVGGLYAVDHLTSVKAKLNSNGKLGALVQHEVLPKSIVTISGEIDTKTLEKYPRFGLSLALKP